MKKYKNLKKINYYSRRYDQHVEVPYGYFSDGATGAADISGEHLCAKGLSVVYTSRSWWVHDVLKDVQTWFDGTPCSNWQASWVLRDILMDEGRWLRAHYWFVGVLVYGEMKNG